MLRRQRACDFCRRRKIRCAPSDNEEGRCASCTEFGLEKCTFLAPTGRQEPTFAYVKQLEDRVASLEALLKKQLSLSDSTAQANLIADAKMVSGEVLDTFHPAGARRVAPSRHPETITESEKTMWSAKGKVYGQSSWIPLLDLANELREEAAGEPVKHVEPIPLSEKKPFTWEDEMRDPDDSPLISQIPCNDTLTELWPVFVRHILPFWPIVHRPTIEVQMSDLLHERSASQARLILLMCALASIYQPNTHNLEWNPPGWKWFSLVRVSHVQLIVQQEACLVDVQVMAMQVLYFYLMGAPHCGWIILGAGIRLAQEVGVHEKSFAKSRGPLEVEMWRRVFWFFVSMDRFFCSILGHSEMIREEYLDLEPPKATLTEPTAQDASNFEYFRAQLQCGRISSFAIRARVATSPWFRAWGFHNKKAVITRTDELLKQWLENLPDQLKWDPERENIIHFEQSAELRLMYCAVTILTHNVVEAAATDSIIIPLSREDLCGYAALQAVEVATPLLKRSPSFFTPILAQAICFGAVVLETRLWAVKKRPDISEEVKTRLTETYNRATDIMKQLATSWPSIARFFFLIDVFVHGDTHMTINDSHTPAESPAPQSIFAVIRHTLKKREQEKLFKSISDSLQALPAHEYEDLDSNTPAGPGSSLNPFAEGPNHPYRPPATLADFDATFSYTPQGNGAGAGENVAMFGTGGEDSSLMTFVNQFQAAPFQAEPAFSWDAILQDVQIGFQEHDEGLFSQRFRGRGYDLADTNDDELIPGLDNAQAAVSDVHTQQRLPTIPETPNPSLPQSGLPNNFQFSFTAQPSRRIQIPWD